jgi:hypothetical protein
MDVVDDEQLLHAAAGAAALRALRRRRQSNLSRPFAVLSFDDKAHIMRYVDYYEDEPPEPSLVDAADPSSLAHAETILRGSGSQLMAWSGQPTEDALKMMPVLCMFDNESKLFFFGAKTLIEGNVMLQRSQQGIHNRIMEHAANRARTERWLWWGMVGFGGILGALLVMVLV